VYIWPDAVRDDDFEWVATSWLKDWLAADCMGTVDPIDNSSLLCPHDKYYVLHCSFIHIEHLFSASSRKLLRSAPNTSLVKKEQFFR